MNQRFVGANDKLVEKRYEKIRRDLPEGGKSGPQSLVVVAYGIRQ